MSDSFYDMKWERYTNGLIQHNPQNLEQMKNLLGSTGCGFCLAKFRQVTLHLGTGMTHSCHHPTPHKIPLEELEANPAALFNTKHLKRARREMLNGDRPSECDYCWRVEDDGGQSDRIFKSLEPWASEFHDDITQLTGDENIFPSYLEVSFGNACNMKCTYCGPEFSSQWVEELKAHGPVKMLEGTDMESSFHDKVDLESLNYTKREHNPYIEAFWKWFPRALPNLRHYRITGGEPLMSKDTFKSIEWLIENPNRDLEFSINTNMSVPDKLWDKFIDAIERLEKSKSVKKITIYSSVEGWGERAEYARTGLDFELLRKRVEQIAAMDNIRVNIMAAFNIFSITSFDKVLEWIYELKQKYNPNSNLVRFYKKTGFQANLDKDFVAYSDKNPSHELIVGLDIPYLRHPSWLDTHFCTHDLLEKYLFPSLAYMSERVVNPEWNTPSGFEGIEFDKFKRIVMHRAHYNRKNHMGRESHPDITQGRAQFYDFVNEMDRRRGTNFVKTFPEMSDFYDVCREANKNIRGNK